jgi:hypothetical protein
LGDPDLLSKLIIDEIMVGCFPELLTGKFSTAVVEPGTERTEILLSLLVLRK